MNVGLIQKAERQMMLDGKSASEIDAMKSAYRKQVFNPDGYSQTAGLGSFASGGEAYGPPPVKGPDAQGIASFGNGGEAAVRLGGVSKKKAPRPVNAPVGRQSMSLTREDQGLLVDFLPIAGDIKGGVEGAEFISEELKRKNPNYFLMGAVGGAAVLGVIPFVGDVAQKMIMRGARNFRKNRVTEDTLEMLSDQDANIVRDLTDKTPVSELTESQRLADEIALDLRSGNIDSVTDDRLELLDVQGDIRLRQHYIDGNVGTDADGVTITLDNAQREARMLAQGYDRVGVHGTMPMEDGASVNDIRVMRPSNSGKSGRGVYLDVEPTGMNFGDGEISNPSGIPYPTANRFAGYFPNPSAIDGGKNAHLRIPEGSQMYPLVLRGKLAKNSTDMAQARAQIIAKNPDIGTIELNDQANQALIDQGFTGIDSKHYGEITSFDGANLRAPTAIFDQRLTHLKNIGMADGGAVMNGIGTLNGVARNMTRGPRGIGSYQQYADGGQVTAPRQTNLLGDPHKLVYINPEEERLLQGIGGYGGPVPGSNGVDAYGFWDSVKSFFSGGNKSTSSAPSRSLRPRARPAHITNSGSVHSGNSNSGPSAAPVAQPYTPAANAAAIAAQQAAAQQAAQEKAAAQQAAQEKAAAQKAAAQKAAAQKAAQDKIIQQSSTGSVAQNALKGAGIGSLRPKARPEEKTGVAGFMDGIASFYNKLPTTRLYKGIANDVTMGFRAGFGDRDSQKKRLEEAKDEDGNPVYSPFEVDEYFLATDESIARQKAQQESNPSNRSDDGPGLSQACPPGYVLDTASGQCVPSSGFASVNPVETPEDVIKYASDYLDGGSGISSGLPPAPVYLESSFAPNTQMFADGGQVMGGLEAIGMGFPGGPPMGGPEFVGQPLPPASGQSMFQRQMGDLMNRPNMGQPLQQYGQYLEQQYGEPDFEQKRDQFLQEVSQKEQQTFQDNAGVIQDNIFPGMHQPTNFPDFSTDFLNGGQPLSSGFNEHFGQIKNPFTLQSFADGGPVYMSEGGSSGVASRRASTEDLANLAKMVRENYGFDPVSVALEQKIDPELALRVMYEESKGKQSAGSEKGARGLMQLMPGTAKELGVNIDDALENYTGGLRYLKQMTNQFGLELGLAAYNAGPGNVAEYQGVPPFEETQNYLRIIAEPFTGNSVEGIINTGAENFMMSQPVFNEADVARGRGVRPPERPITIDQQYYQDIRPQARPEALDPATDLRPMSRPLGIEAAIEDANLADKYSLENMAKVLGSPMGSGAMAGQGGIASMLASR